MVPIVATSPNADARLVIESWSSPVNKRNAVDIESKPATGMISFNFLLMLACFENRIQKSESVIQRTNIPVMATGFAELG